MSRGYEQAVLNMAYAIDQLAIKTMDPIVAEHGLMSTEEVSKLMSPEELNEWQEIERVSAVVCETYDVEYDDFMNDVQTELWKGLLNSQEIH